MNKAAGFAVGVIVAAGALATAGAWYTGTRLEGVLREAIAESNRQLQQALPGTESGLELVSLDRHLFGSTARYRFHYRNLADGQSEPLELSFTDDMEHGPFPLSRLKTLRLMPVMAASNYRLERTPSVDTWFDLSAGVAPVSGHASIGYDQAVDGTVRLAPLDGALDATTKLTFSGLELNHHSTRDAAEVRMDGDVRSLRLETAREDGTPVQMELTGLNLASTQHKGPADLYLGDALGRAERLRVTAGEDMPAFDLRDLALRSESRLENDNLVVAMTDDVGMLNYGGQDVGSARLAFSMRNLEPASVKAINELYARYLKRLQAQGQTVEGNAAAPLPEMTAEERTQLHDSLGRLLAAKPVLALDELSVKTAHGEGRFNLSVNLGKPSSFDLPADRLAREIVQRLDSRLSVAKAVLEDFATLSVQGGASDPAAVAQQAQATRDMLANIALSSGLTTLQGDDLVTSFAYADGQVDFNGKRMPLEQVASMLMGMAQAGALPSDQSPEPEGDEAQDLDEDTRGE